MEEFTSYYAVLIILDYGKLCSSIFEIDPKIRGALIFHTSGELLAGGMRQGVESYLPQEEITKSTHYAIIRWEARKMLAPFLGTGKYSLTEYEKVKRITFPLNPSALLMISTEVSADDKAIILKVQELINNS